MSGRHILYIAVALGALLVNIPYSKLFGASGEQRRSDVISEFVYFRADPPASDNAEVRKYRQTKALTKLLEHTHPDVNAAIAAYMDVTPSAYRKMKTTQIPLMAWYAQSVTSRSHDLERTVYGETGNWHWTLVTETSTSWREDQLPKRSCAVWLLFWDAGNWYHVQVSQPMLHDPLVKAIPEFSSLPLDSLPDCGLPPAGEPV